MSDTTSERVLQQSALVGVGLLAVAMVLIPTGDGIAKYVGANTGYGPVFLAWSRFAIGTALLLPVALAIGAYRGLPARFYFQQAVRGLLVALAIVLILRAVQTIPLADAFGAFFIGPGVATLLAAVLLRERVGALEWGAVALGFLGVLLVVKPAPGMQPGLLYALLGGTSYGAMIVATRWAAGIGPPLAQLTAQFGFGGLLLAPLGATEFVREGVQMPVWLLLMCACSMTANLLSIMALGRAPAAYLAPVIYFQLVAASLISIFVFGDALDPLAAVGLVLIIAAGVSRIPAARRAASPPAPPTSPTRGGST